MLFHSDSHIQIEKDKFVYVCPKFPCNALWEILQYRINFSSLRDLYELLFYLQAMDPKDISSLCLTLTLQYLPILSHKIPLLRENLCPNFLILYLHAHTTSFNFSTEIFNEEYESAEASYEEGKERGSTVNGHHIRTISPVHLAFGETVVTATFLSTRAVSANYIPMKLVFF